MNLQAAAGLALVGLGVLAFLDRDRPEQARSHYYVVVPNLGPIVQAAIGVVFTVIGFALLFAA